MMRAYNYEQLGQLKKQILAICEEVKRLNPEAWAGAHDGSFSDASRRFNDLCVQALRKVGIYAGMNGKRGDRNSRSDDVLAFGLVPNQGGAQDKGGTFAEMAIIDFIVGAGTPGASIGWIDQSKAAPGIFLEPQNLFGKLPGEVIIPAPTPAPPPPEPVPGPQRPGCLIPADLQPLLVAVADIQHRLSMLETRANQLLTSNDFHKVIQNEVVAHIDDAKGRIDSVSEAVRGLNSLKCRLRF